MNLKYLIKLVNSISYKHVTLQKNISGIINFNHRPMKGLEEIF